MTLVSGNSFELEEGKTFTSTNEVQRERNPSEGGCPRCDGRVGILAVKEVVLRVGETARGERITNEQQNGQNNKAPVPLGDDLCAIHENAVA
jgi:hypothetical protein